MILKDFRWISGNSIPSVGLQLLFFYIGSEKNVQQDTLCQSRVVARALPSLCRIAQSRSRSSQLAYTVLQVAKIDVPYWSDRAWKDMDSSNSRTSILIIWDISLSQLGTSVELICDIILHKCCINELLYQKLILTLRLLTIEILITGDQTIVELLYRCKCALQEKIIDLAFYNGHVALIVVLVRPIQARDKGKKTTYY